jgi:hypothetical protein
MVEEKWVLVVVLLLRRLPLQKQQHPLNYLRQMMPLPMRLMTQQRMPQH